MSMIDRFSHYLPVVSPLIFAGFLNVPFSSVASVGVDLSQASDAIHLLSSSFSRRDFRTIATTKAGEYGSFDTYIVYSRINGGTSRVRYVERAFTQYICPSEITNRTDHSLTLSEQAIFVRWLNKIINEEQPVLSPLTIPVSDSELTDIIGFESSYYSCAWSDDPANHSGISGITTDAFDMAVLVPPPFLPSVCTFFTRTISFEHTGALPGETGLTQGSNLEIICSSGTPVDYQISLRGEAASDGGVALGNGVSAYLRLDGQPLTANGGGRVILRKLTAGDHSLIGELAEKKAASGVRPTSGYLVLEAL